MVKIFTFIFICLGIQSFSNTRQIDTLLVRSFKAYSKMQMIESAQFASNALKLSKINQYDYGKAKSHIYLAKILNTIGHNKEAIYHLDELAKTKSFKKDPILKAENHRIKGRIYSSLKLYKLAIAEFTDQLRATKNIKDVNKQKLSKIFTHENMVQVYNYTNETDSIKKHISLQEKIIKQYKEEEIFYYLSTLYVQKANLLLKQNQFIEAEKYLQKSLSILKKYNANNTVFTYTALGNLKAKQKNIEEAALYYKQGLLNAISLNDNISKSIIYKKLALLYSYNDKYKKESVEYFQLHHTAQDSIDIANRNLQDHVFQQLVNLKDDDKNIDQSSYLYLFLLFSTVGGSASYIVYRKLQNKPNNSTEEDHSDKNLYSDSHPDSDNQIINEQFLEHFEHLVKLGKQNSPEFIVLFIELFPNFINNLKSIDPHIKTSELSFCAMAYLNFSTKNIAEYTFVTIRAVQIRKNRLRKKYNISSDEDFNLWMQNLGK